MRAKFLTSPTYWYYWLVRGGEGREKNEMTLTKTTRKTKMGDIRFPPILRYSPHGLLVSQLDKPYPNVNYAIVLVWLVFLHDPREYSNDEDAINSRHRSNDSTPVCMYCVMIGGGDQ